MTSADRQEPKGGIQHHFRPPDPADLVDHPVAPGSVTTERPQPPRPWFALIAGQWPLFVSLVVVATGVGFSADSYWRRGATIAGAGILLAALLRAVLPERVAGLLRCRSRWFDVLFTALVGGGILLLAWIISPTRK